MSLARLATAGMAFLPLVLASGSVRADDDIAALRGRFDQIKELVAEFETRLNALEVARSSVAPSSTQPVVPLPTATRADWPDDGCSQRTDRRADEDFRACPQESLVLLLSWRRRGLGFFDTHGQASSVQRPTGGN